jgi:hypothetical protein
MIEARQRRSVQTRGYPANDEITVDATATRGCLVQAPALMPEQLAQLIVTTEPGAINNRVCMPAAPMKKPDSLAAAQLIASGHRDCAVVNITEAPIGKQVRICIWRADAEIGFADKVLPLVELSLTPSMPVGVTINAIVRKRFPPPSERLGADHHDPEIICCPRQ